MVILHVIFIIATAKDLCLMSGMNIPNHRFSISWSRIFPDGTGKVNKDGIDFYNRMIDFSLELGLRRGSLFIIGIFPMNLKKKADG